MMKSNDPESLAQARILVRPGLAATVVRPQFVLGPQYHPPLVAPHPPPVVVPPPQPVRLPNGPVVTPGSPSFFNDRYDANTKWYLPDFALKAPLKDSFCLECQQSGVDKQANPTYAGKATFVVSKSMPAAVQALTKTPGLNYKEIPLHSLTMSFTVNLSDHSTLPYPAQLVQQGDDYIMSISLGNQESLVSFYKFISDPANSKFCNLCISAAYLGYFLKAKPPQFNAFQTAFVANHLQTMQMRNVTMAPKVMMASRAIPLAAIEREPVAPIWRAPLPPPPAHNPADDYELRGAVPFARTISGVNFDCRTFPESYLEKHGDSATTTAFGCKPPFGDASARRNIYTKFYLQNGDLADKDYGIKGIYRNTYNDGFLVIPSRYSVALVQSADEQLLLPAARLFTFIDLKDVQHGIDSSTAVFQFAIAPEVSQHQLVMIKKLILSNLPAKLNKTIDDIFVEFPQKIGDPDKVVFDSTRIPKVVLNPLDVYRNGVQGSKYFDLQFQNVSIGKGDAEWVAKQAKLAGLFPPPLTTTVTLDVDSDVEPAPQSTIALSLNTIAGNGLIVQADDTGGRHLVNRTFYEITVDSYQAAATDEPTLLKSALRVPANNSVSADSVGVTGDVSHAVFGYAYHANADYVDQVLKEIRVVNVDTIDDDIIVTNNTGLFSLYNITSIDFAVSIIEPGETDPKKALAVASTTLIKDGVINHVPFTLPVAKYLSTKSAVYSTVVNFANNTQQVNPAQLIEDLNKAGKLINLTVSRLNLSKPQ
jgi:hypothetical protein